MYSLLIFGFTHSLCIYIYSLYVSLCVYIYIHLFTHIPMFSQVKLRHVF